MTPLTRVRQLAPAMLMAAALLVLGACGGDHPNSTFNHHTEFNTEVDGLWDKLLLWGTVVFVIVEVILIYTIIKFRKRENSPPVQMTHGNTALEITWTVLPIFILLLIAVPTVKTIFKTQAPAPAGALQVEVVGHQWWWEFKYPEFGFTTANELYLPAGKTVNFKLDSYDVIHSFWVPQLGGKRDLMKNRTNHIWYTPNATIADSVWNGFCTEYCGASHANMRIRAYIVSAEQFDAWVRGQKTAAVFNAPAPAPAPAGKTGMASAATANGNTTSLSPGVLEMQTASKAPQQAAGQAAPAEAAPPAANWYFPAEKIPAYAVPKTPIPAGIPFDDALLANGDATRGQQIVNGKGMCRSCHSLEPQTIMPLPVVGPNLSHLATRHTIAGAIFPNDAHHLARWVKDARRMKPGSYMPTLGADQIDPIDNKIRLARLTDAEIADIVAYLRALK